MRYTITIKDNEKDEILTNEETNCIIGAFNLADDVKVVNVCDANWLEISMVALAASLAADNAISELKEEEK